MEYYRAPHEEIGLRTLCMSNLPSVGKIFEDASETSLGHSLPERVMCMSNLPSMNKIMDHGSVASCIDGSTGTGGKTVYSSGDPVGALRSLPGIVEVRNRIGVGSFSHVYQCSMTNRNEDVAVKVLLQVPGSEQNREANILLQMCHPNLIHLLECIQERHIHALVLELCTGGSLMKFLHGPNKPLSLKFNLYKRLNGMVGIISAVQYLHAHNIVHRDIKSSNCFLSRTIDTFSRELPPLKLGDLGLARPITMSPMTRGTGTVRYMAPEVIMSKHYGLAADVFSLAIMLHEFASGEIPFQELRRNDASLAACIVQGQRPSLDSLPPSAIRVELPSILETCWAMDASSRLTVQDLHSFLTNVIRWIPEEEISYV